jgi:hypothetical protein
LHSDHHSKIKWEKNFTFKWNFTEFPVTLQKSIFLGLPHASMHDNPLYGQTIVRGLQLLSPLNHDNNRLKNKTYTNQQSYKIAGKTRLLKFCSKIALK